MTCEDPFESSRLALSGARRHINDFELQEAALRTAKNWCSMSTAAEPDGISLSVTSTAVVPSEMKLVAFDLVHNLRAALDFAVYAATIVLDRERNGTKFPVGTTRLDLEGDAKRKCRDVPKEMLDFLLKIDARKEGNHLLWGLNTIRNVKGHRFLVPFGSAVALNSVGEPSSGLTVTNEWDPATGRLLVRPKLAGPDTVAGICYAFRLNILIGAGVFKGQPALSLFKSMLLEVERVVAAIRSETYRILEQRK